MLRLNFIFKHSLEIMIHGISLAVTLIFYGCGPIAPREYSPMQFAMDGVKLISADIDSGYSQQTFEQSSYVVNQKQRLLIRLEKLLGKVNHVKVDSEKKVWVEVSTPSPEDALVALPIVKLCPVTRNWMMLATWQFSHPFLNGKWKELGGDFDSEGCMLPMQKDQSRVLRFDATQWFINYPRGQSTNFGLIIMADDSVTILGEPSGTFSPRFVFESYLQPY